MHKIKIEFTPKIEDEEELIFKEVFSNHDLVFSEYKTKGIIWGAFDIQIIIDLLNNPSITAFLNGTEFIRLITVLVKKLFSRNKKNIMEDNSRPRYTNLTISMKTSLIVISNANKDNKIIISKFSTDYTKIEESEDVYSDEKLKNYLKDSQNLCHT